MKSELKWGVAQPQACLKPLANSFLICLVCVSGLSPFTSSLFCPSSLFVWCVNVFSLAFIILFPFPALVGTKKRDREKNFLLGLLIYFQHLFTMSTISFVLSLCVAANQTFPHFVVCCVCLCVCVCVCV